MQKPTLLGAYQVSSHVDIKAVQPEVWSIMKDFNNVYTWAPG